MSHEAIHPVGDQPASDSQREVLLGVGGDHDRWIQNLGTERDWQFQAAPNPSLNDRAIPLSMGKVLGGGSSINAMIWARGHKADWDFFASESGDRAWGYESVLDVYRRIEDWHGAPDAAYRGTGGPVFVQPKPDSQPIGAALLDGIGSAGIPLFEHPNGRMMEADGGGARTDMRIRDGRRQSVFRSYVFPYIDRPNLTVRDHRRARGGRHPGRAPDRPNRPAAPGNRRRMSGDQRRSRPRSVALRIRNSPCAEAAQDTKITEPERAELVELLLESEREFIQELEGLIESSRLSTGTSDRKGSELRLPSEALPRSLEPNTIVQ